MCDHCGCRTLTPVARLMAEHDRLRELSGQIHRAVRREDDETARALFDELLLVLGPHVLEEETRLFPLLRRQEEFTGHVGQLQSEHAGLYDAVDHLEQPPGDTDAAGLAGRASWRTGVLAILRELDDHLYKEDSGLFRAAIAALDGSDWDAIDRRAA